MTSNASETQRHQISNDVIYMHHAIACAPRTSAAVARGLGELDWARYGGTLYGAWRSQIGRPRDEITAISVWTRVADSDFISELIAGLDKVRTVVNEPMHATLRPVSSDPPRRQGNYAFRWFELPEEHWEEFLGLCVAAWPGFEAAYDS